MLPHYTLFLLPTLATLVMVQTPATAQNVLNQHPLDPLTVAQTPEVRRVDADQLRQQGEQQLEAGLSRQAAKSLESALRLYQDLRDTEQARQTIRQLRAVYVELGDAQSLQKLQRQEFTLRDDYATFDPEQVLQSGTLNVDDIFAIANSIVNPERIDALLAVLEQKLAQQTAPEAELFMLLGGVHMLRGNSSQAIDYLEQGFEQNRDVQLLYQIAQVHWQEQDYAQAIAQLDQALALVEETSTPPSFWLQQVPQMLEPCNQFLI